VKKGRNGFPVLMSASSQSRKGGVGEGRANESEEPKKDSFHFIKKKDPGGENLSLGRKKGLGEDGREDVCGK